jgi:cell division protein FtsI (penicillin-binding protein 3)
MKRERPCSPFHADPEPEQFRQAIRLDGTTKQALETGRTRLLVASLLFAAAFLIVAGRLVSVALISSGGEPSIAEAPRATQLETERADIVDRNGIVLATNLVTASLYANPREVPSPRAAAAALSKVLPELPQAEVESKLASGKSFVWLKRNLTPKQQYAVNRLGIPGLSFQREERRVYPHGNLAAHILGFTDIDNRGIAGVERQFESRLAEQHAPLALSIDIRLQHILKEELSRSIHDFSAIGGAGVILDARNGEVLAMISLPDFDPNEPGRASADTRFNRATLGVYEMGSVFKVFTTAMALDAGVTSLKGGYDASHPIKVSRYTISDYHAKNRWLSVPEIFIYSSNIGSAKMALDVGPEGQRAFLKRLGMLSPLALELPELGEPQGPAQWKELAAMTIAFGHGLSVTPMHVASGVASVVNGGLKVRSTIVTHPQTRHLPSVAAADAAGRGAGDRQERGCARLPGGRQDRHGGEGRGQGLQAQCADLLLRRRLPHGRPALRDLPGGRRAEAQQGKPWLCDRRLGRRPGGQAAGRAHGPTGRHRSRRGEEDARGRRGAARGGEGGLKVRSGRIWRVALG